MWVDNELQHSHCKYNILYLSKLSNSWEYRWFQLQYKENKSCTSQVILYLCILDLRKKDSLKNKLFWIVLDNCQRLIILLMLCDLLKGYFYHEIFLTMRMLHSASVVSPWNTGPRFWNFQGLSKMQTSLLCNWTDSLSRMAFNKSKFL